MTVVLFIIGFITSAAIFSLAKEALGSTNREILWLFIVVICCASFYAMAYLSEKEYILTLIQSGQ